MGKDEGGRRIKDMEAPGVVNGRHDETWRGQNVCFNIQTLFPDWAQSKSQRI